MADHGESELRKWALERPNGDPIKPQDIVKLVFAFDDDNTAKFEELKAAMRSNMKRFADLEETIKMLGDRQTAWELECPAREAEGKKWHKAFHAEHLEKDHVVPVRRLDDPPDSEFLEHRESAHPSDDEEMGDIRRVWRFARWFVAAALLITLDILAHRIAGM